MSPTDCLFEELHCGVAVDKPDNVEALSETCCLVLGVHCDWIMVMPLGRQPVLQKSACCRIALQDHKEQFSSLCRFLLQNKLDVFSSRQLQTCRWAAAELHLTLGSPYAAMQPSSFNLHRLHDISRLCQTAN